MPKLLRGLAIAAGSVVGLVLVLFAIVWAVSAHKRHQKFPINHALESTGPTQPVTSALLTRGKVQAIVHACTHCHGPDLAGTTLASGGMTGVLAAPNLTTGRGGIGARLTDADIARAVRQDVDRTGRPLMVMPGEHYYADLSDEDMGALIAFIRHVKPVDKVQPPVSFGPMGHLAVAIGQLPIAPENIAPTVRPGTVNQGVSLEHGKYLATMCYACHGKDYGGLPAGYGVPPGANLTMGGDLKNWTEADFVHVLRTGVTPDGRKLNKTMPWQAFALLRDDELRSLYMYLRSLPAKTRIPPTAPGWHPPVPVDSTKHA
jgi:cytochrome c553